MNAEALRRRWEDIPTETVLMTKWNTPEAQRFWIGVRDMLASGHTIDEIGTAIDVRLLGARYKSYGQAEGA